MTTMRAARFHGAKDIRVEDVPIPELRPGEVLIEIEWCGICGSDLHEYTIGPSGCLPPGKPHPLTGEHMPSILGHEFCGVVKSVGTGSKFKPGQKVMADPHLHCGKCSNCETNRDHQCETLGFLGYSGRGGGLSEYVPVREEKVYPLPENVSTDFAALIEPLAVGHHAVKTLKGMDLKDKSILIVGGGPVAYALIFSLRGCGAQKIYVSEPALIRREQIGKLADAVIDPTKENVGERCRALTNNKGIDVGFDCAGNQKGLEAGFDALRSGATWCNLAIWETPMQIPFFPFFWKEPHVISSCCYNIEDFRETMELIGQGKYDGYEGMVTSRISVEDVVAKGFEELINNKDEHIKILVTPKKSSSQ